MAADITIASGARELAEWARRSAPIEIVEIAGRQVALVPADKSIQSVKKFVDEYAATPDRKKGVARLGDLNSFIEHANRFKDAGSALFARRDKAEPSLTVVLNYHEAGGGAARFGDHRGVYAFPLSDEWKAWTKVDNEKMGQADFAAFLEDRIVDVLPPPEMDAAKEGVHGDAILELAKLVGGSFAGPEKLIALGRGMAVNAEARVKGAVNLSSGETTIQYEEVHADGAGEPLKVPSLFLIGIPVFANGVAYRIGIRLRYRVAGGRVAWFYSLYRPERSFDDAFLEACATAAAATGLPLFYGAPEA